MNLINGQKPEFGNLEHIEFVKRIDRIFTGKESFQQIEWEPCHYWGSHTDTGKPKFQDRNWKYADAVVDYIICPKCEKLHCLLVAFDPQIAKTAWYQVLIEIDNSIKEFICWNCKTKFEVDEERNVFVKINN